MKNIFGNTREIRKRMTLEERSREKQKCLQNMEVDSALNEDYTQYYTLVDKLFFQKSKHYFIAEEI